jgi:hypothetical protein
MCLPTIFIQRLFEKIYLDSKSIFYKDEPFSIIKTITYIRIMFCKYKLQRTPQNPQLADGQFCPYCQNRRSHHSLRGRRDKTSLRLDQVSKRGFARRGLFQVVDIQSLQFVQGESAGFSQHGQRFVPLSLFDEYENRVRGECRQREPI